MIDLPFHSKDAMKLKQLNDQYGDEHWHDARDGILTDLDWKEKN